MGTADNTEDKLLSDEDIDHFLAQQGLSMADIAKSANTVFVKTFVGDKDERRHY